MPTAEQFREELSSIFEEALLENRSTVEVNAGELHSRVGGYPGPQHRMPLCCSIMREALNADAGDEVVDEPPSGTGAKLTIRYVLPRPEEITTD
jgi:hypothetical protein